MIINTGSYFSQTEVSNEPKQKPTTIVIGFYFVFLFLCIQAIVREISIGANINEEQFCKVKSDFIVNHHNLTNKRSR